MSAGLGAALAAVGLVLVPSGTAAAATPLCTITVNAVRGGQNLAVPATGSGNLSVDGDFGPRTEAALKGVQSTIGTAADGGYGPNTRDRMRFRSNDVPTLCHHF